MSHQVHENAFVLAALECPERYQTYWPRMALKLHWKECFGEKYFRSAANALDDMGLGETHIFRVYDRSSRTIEMFPFCRVDPSSLVIEDGRICTALEQEA